jgi:hypothetical protein
MFSIIDKTLEKRLLSSHLHIVGLALDEMHPGIVKQLLHSVHAQVVSVSKKYKQPIHVITENIVSSATWGIAYCLLGPGRLLDVYPEFKDRTEEAEMELLLLEQGERSENNIYQQVYAILLDSPHCHPEVRLLFNRSRLARGATVKRASGSGFMLMH